MGAPLYRVVPESHFWMPSMISMSVVLPAPFGPSRPKQMPCLIERLTLSTARTPG